MFEREIVVDNFAGGGGASEGIRQAIGRDVDDAINHDPIAMAMHKANHPGTNHWCEDVWDVDPRDIAKGRPVGLCWLSPDCKHFSKAKGGKPVEKHIRGLAWVAVRWAATVKPRVIILENVEEFKTWGPLLESGIPDPKRKGRTFNSFVHALERHGYKVEHRELRACDYGAPTIRKRLFLVARCDGRPIVWPEPTHGDPKTEAVKSGKLLPWRTAAEIIDWSLPCPSIFERKWPLAENTLRRIARGIQKFVVDSPEPFIIKVNHEGEAFRGQRTSEPMQTITAKNGWGIVAPVIGRQFGKSIGSGMGEPLGTVTAGYGGKSQLVTALLSQYHGERPGGNARGQAVDDPLLTVDGSNRYSLVAATIAKHFGGHETPGAPVQLPLPTVTMADHNALVTSHLVKMRGTNTGQPVTEPLQTITAGGLHFGEVRAFLMKYYGTATGQGCREPLQTVTAHDRFGLVTVHGEDYQIVDIGMRMLEPRELFNAQGFPSDYIIDRDDTGKPFSKATQVARCGNAVPPPFAEALVRANLPEMCADYKDAEAKKAASNVAVD